MSERKKWNQRTVGHLISYSNDSESDNPPPDSPLTLHSHLTSILYLHSHPMPILSLRGHLKSTLPLQTGTLLSPPRVTLPKLQSFNPETEQGFCLNNQLILTLNLIRNRQPDTRIGFEPHPSYMKHWSFID